MDALRLATSVACALVAGVFFAFSAFVLPALVRLGPHDGSAAMRSVNARAVRPPKL